MEHRSRTEFERCAITSGLLSKEQLTEAVVAMRSSDDEKSDQPSATDGTDEAEQLAAWLVAEGQLNAWQAQQLLDSQTRFHLGPYRIVDSLGSGGMGQVFRARHISSGREVAIKVLPREKSTPEAEASFVQEARTQASLDHENLVRALDVGYDGRVYYLVFEYVAGSDLRKLIRQAGPLDMRTAAAIISQVSLGLAHAHQRGLIHRDVKPGNVLVTADGRAKLADLGLAGPLGHDVRNDPRRGKIVGTPDYLSPDHIQTPWNPTPAWDIYSLGCTLYYAVTSKVPFPGGSTAEKAHAHCQMQPLDPRRLNPSLSSSFVDLIADMMAKDPTERIADAEQVAARLAQWGDKPVAIPAVANGNTALSANTFVVPAVPRRMPSRVEASRDLDDTADGLPQLAAFSDTQSSRPDTAKSTCQEEGGPPRTDHRSGRRLCDFFRLSASLPKNRTNAVLLLMLTSVVCAGLLLAAWKLFFRLAALD